MKTATPHRLIKLKVVSAVVLSALVFVGCPPPHQHIDFLEHGKKKKTTVVTSVVGSTVLRLSSRSHLWDCDYYEVSLHVEVRTLNRTGKLEADPWEPIVTLGQHRMEPDIVNPPNESGDLDSNTYEVTLSYEAEGAAPHEGGGPLPVTIEFNSFLKRDGQTVEFEPVHAVEVKRCAKK